ncbi:MAG TPA: formate dehydrogenase accessory sulfurtransferase FdhD [Symbiobacteriaceae bacterium]|nr:formate dehydrogenase accessory sulfurtransferase FdhD [Symbiobacteriaceae bacterium]
MQRATVAPVERPTTIYLNDTEWLTVQTTPVDLTDWVTGYLFGEGVISRPEELDRVVADEDRGLVWVDLPDGRPPDPDRTLPLKPVAPGPQVAAETLLVWMTQMLDDARLYQETGGMHVAAAFRLDTGERLLREDIGRHNAVDKVLGAALAAGWPGEQTVILTSGRISYEMCTRLARFGAGLGVSRTAATDQAYGLATRLGIELVGYVRSAASLIIYTEAHRVRRRVTA